MKTFAYKKNKDGLVVEFVPLESLTPGMINIKEYQICSEEELKEMLGDQYAIG